MLIDGVFHKLDVVSSAFFKNFTMSMGRICPEAYPFDPFESDPGNPKWKSFQSAILLVGRGNRPSENVPELIVSNLFEYKYNVSNDVNPLNVAGLIVVN